MSRHEVDNGFRAGIFKSNVRREPLDYLSNSEAAFGYLTGIFRTP